MRRRQTWSRGTGARSREWASCSTEWAAPPTPRHFTGPLATHRAARAVPSQFARRGQARLLAAVVILGAWGAGLTMLVQREFYQGRPQRLAEAALRLNPSATYFAVEQGGKVIGFASTTIDTLTNGVDAIDYFVAHFSVGGTPQRTSKRSIVKLPPGPSAKPKGGRKYSLPTFDPSAMSSAVTGFSIDAESLFTLVDSAKFSQDKGEWVSALTDTVRAWRVVAPDVKGGFSGWIDAQGRVVQAAQPDGITLKRTAYELAFENWRITRDRATAANAGTGDILERTAIAAGAKLGRSKLLSMTVQLGAPNLKGYDLDGGRQHFSGDTLKVVREKDATIGAGTTSWQAFGMKDLRAKFRGELADEPTLQVRNREMIKRALAIIGNEPNPRSMVQKINEWVSDSVAKVVTFSVPNALAVLRSRKGDCNEHTQLYVALVRALGIPARVATGLLYVNGKFYYHAWAEVWLGEWVAVDPTFGQFPADAAHLRFVVGGLSRRAELLQLMGNLKIKVVEAK